MASKRALFTETHDGVGLPKKKGKRTKGAGKLVEVKKEKEFMNGADDVEVGAIIRARYGTTNSETLVGDQVCVIARAHVCLFFYVFFLLQKFVCRITLFIVLLHLLFCLYVSASCIYYLLCVCCGRHELCSSSVQVIPTRLRITKRISVSSLGFGACIRMR